MNHLSKQKISLPSKITIWSVILLLLSQSILTPLLHAYQNKRIQKENEQFLTEMEKLQDSLNDYLDVENVLNSTTIAVSRDSEIVDVKLLGVEIPEKSEENTMKKLLNYIGDYSVRLSFDPLYGEEKDENGCLNAYVHLPDGSLLNAKMIQSGYGILSDDTDELLFSDELIEAADHKKRDKPDE